MVHELTTISSISCLLGLEEEKPRSGEVTGDNGLGRGQMAKEVSQVLQQFKDMAAYTGLGEIVLVAWSEGFQVSSLPPARLSVGTARDL